MPPLDVSLPLIVPTTRAETSSVSINFVISWIAFLVSATTGPVNASVPIPAPTQRSTMDTVIYDVLTAFLLGLNCKSPYPLTGQRWPRVS